MGKTVKETGTNQSDILEMNRSIILRTIKRKGICSRAELAALTGLQKASVTKITSALIELNIIKEIGLIQNGKNRRSIGLSLNAKLYKVIGVKFARGSFSVGLFDISGKSYSVCTKPVDMQQSPHKAIAHVKEVINGYLDKETDIVAVGIAVPGPYLRDEGRIVMMTGMPGWEEVNFKEELIDAFCIPVYIEHDANAGALAEWWFGEHGEQVDTIVHLLASEGIGAGIIQSGHLISGAQGIAGEIGHVSVDINGRRCECGNYGCLEKYCSARALLEHAREQLAEYPESALCAQELTIDSFFKCFDAGDPLTVKVFRKIAWYLGCGVVVLINTYNPHVIVISDYITRGGQLLLDIIQQVVEERVWSQIAKNVVIKISNLPDDPILYGAMALATDRVLKLPTLFFDLKSNGNAGNSIVPTSEQADTKIS